MSWTKNESVVWEELDGGALLIDTKSGTRWTLSATASAAWKLCDGKRSLDEMAAALRQSGESIAAFCRQFETLGLLRHTPKLHPVMLSSTSFRSSASNPFSFQLKGVGNGPRRRTSPRGNSGPG